MKYLLNKASILVLGLVAAVVILLPGCGADVADSQGCPSGSYLANSTDILTMPEDGDETKLSPFLSPYPGGPLHLTPILVTVTDAQGVPRNNVCVRFYSDGIWYTEHTHSTLATVDASNSVVAVTNDAGVIILHWSTYILPSANAATVDASTTPPTVTEGADISGDSFIQAYSGTLSDIFIEAWTVQGEQSPN
jgi:hypothetical protein